ncbi:hypothetical protein BKA93DRAFT_737066 [Sparassis latifolia]
MKSTPTILRCTGIPVEWPTDLGHFNETFPWSRIGDGPGTLPFYLEVHSQCREICGQSKACLGVLPGDATHCSECAAIPKRITELASLAREVKRHTRYEFLNAVQLRELVRERDDEVPALRLQMLNSSRKSNNMLVRVTDHQRLLMTLSEGNIPRVQKLLQVALDSGASIQTIIGKLGNALEGSYHARSYTDFDFDLATLVYRIGGRSLLYALSHSLGLPSLRALRNSLTFTRITPTVGTITTYQIEDNIKEVVLRTRARANMTSFHGVSVLMDEVALEEMAIHFKHANSVGGLCWKHASNVDLVLRDYNSALNLAEALVEGRVHMGKEMSVAAIACFGEPGIYPILAAPTCKQETASDMEFIFNSIIEAWDNEGAAAVGRIWSFATDGDATRRAAGYKVFLKNDLDPKSKLYGILSNMPGLNLRVGDNDITLDFDYKHIFKRFCTLIRSPSGIVLNNGRIINSTMLSRYLRWLPGHDDTSVQKLLYPDDPQDVPRAVELMHAIIDLSKMDIPANSNLDIIGDIDAIRLLAQLLESLLEPFINTDFSLSDQVCSLVKFLHLCFSFFRVHRLTFLSNQLFGDAMTMIKNILFCTAKHQLEYGALAFYIFEAGTDRLERLFGRLRMLGAHDAGMNYRQGVDRLGHATDIDGCFARNPQLDPGHRRIKMTRTEGVDHLNAESWHGDLISGHCNLQSAWKAGREAAIHVLKSSQLPPEAYDYTAIFQTCGVDFLRPFGQNKYPGIEGDEDRSVDLVATVSHTEATSQHNDTADVDGVVALTLEEALGDVPDTTELPSGPGIDSSDYLQHNGKWIHKQSVCCLVINTDYVHKSFNRLERVRGFTKVNAKRDLNADNLLDPESFFTGDPLLTIVRTDKTLSLALLRSTLVTEGGIQRSSIKMATLASHKANVKITGQIVTLVQCNYSGLSRVSASTCVEPVPSAPTSSVGQPTPEPARWIWTGGYSKVDSSMRGTTELTEKPVVITCPGYLTELVNPHVVEAATVLYNSEQGEVNSSGKTWELDEEMLLIACQTLWDRVVEVKLPLTSITSVASFKLKSFPYARRDGSEGLLCIKGSQQLATEHSDKVSRECHFCGHTPDNWRAHIGMHILRAMRRVREVPALREQVGSMMPCGFCGRSGNSNCAVTLKISSRTFKVECKCPFFLPFRYGFAEKGSEKTPCRNVPIICSLCPKPSNKTVPPPAIWRYNMDTHLRLQHPEYASPSDPVGLPIPVKLWHDMAISMQEEKALQIPDPVIPPPFRNFKIDENNVGVGSKRPATDIVPNCARKRTRRGVADQENCAPPTGSGAKT